MTLFYTKWVISLQLSSVAWSKVYFEHNGFNNQWRIYPIWLAVGTSQFTYIFLNCQMIFFLNSAEEKERMEWQRSLEAKKHESLGKKENRSLRE